MALTAQSTLRLATAALDAAGMRAVLDSSGIDPRSCGDLAAVAIAAWRDGWAASGTAAKLAAALRLLDEYGGLDTQPALAGALLHGGPSEAIEVLLAAGADVATESWLHKVPTATVLTMLRVAGAVTAGRGDDGGPLHFACVHGGGCPIVLRLLMGSGADVNATTACRETPLDWAIANRAGGRGGWGRTVATLLELGADPATTGRGSGFSVRDYVVERLVARAVHLQRAYGPVAAAGQQFSGRRGVIAALARQAAWGRRRHLLLAVHGRCGAVRLVPAGGRDAAPQPSASS